MSNERTVPHSLDTSQCTSRQLAKAFQEFHLETALRALIKNFGVASIKDAFTFDAKIHHDAFTQMTLSILREATEKSCKVAFVMSTETDGLSLISCLQKVGYKTTLIDHDSISTEIFTKCVDQNQALVFTTEAWKLLAHENKLKTLYLVIGLRPTESHSSLVLLDGVDAFEKTICIPYVEDTTGLDSLSESAGQKSTMSEVLEETTSTRMDAESSVDLPKMTWIPIGDQQEELTEKVHIPSMNLEPDLKMLLNLKQYARSTIAEICSENNQRAETKFQELDDQFCTEKSFFCNMLQNWIDKAHELIPDSTDIRLFCLQETCKAVGLLDLLGSSNIPFLFTAALNKLKAFMISKGTTEDKFVKSIELLKQILQTEDQNPKTVDFHATYSLESLVEILIEGKKTATSFHGLIIVHSRVTIHALCTLVTQHTDLQDVTFLPLYSTSKDKSSYSVSQQEKLRMTKTKRDEQLTRFKTLKISVLITVSLSLGDFSLPPFDLLIAFGCTSDKQATCIPAKQKWSIQSGPAKVPQTRRIL